MGIQSDVCGCKCFLTWWRKECGWQRFEVCSVYKYVVETQGLRNWVWEENRWLCWCDTSRDISIKYESMDFIRFLGKTRHMHTLP